MLLTVDRSYLFQRFHELAQIGRRPDGRGYERLAFTPAERQAHQWFRDQAQALGLAVWSDAAGNSFADWDPGLGASTRALAVGSHLDTVPFGGAYDGGLGVVAALAVAKAFRDANIPVKHRLRIAAFTDEEGPRFGTGLLGSKAVAGLLDLELVRAAQDSHGIRLEDAMARAGLTLEALGQARQSLPSFLGYLELHIEQGPRLEQSGLKAAAVTVITGIRQLALEFEGKANHAGTTPKPARQNALRAAADTISRFGRWVDETENLVANPGRIEIHPNAANVIPGRVRLEWDIRSPSVAILNQAVEQLMRCAEDACAPFRIGVQSRLFHDVPPCELSEEWVALTERAAADLGLPTTRLVSWAGHDAGVLGSVIPAAMIFVPSRDGVSHAPDEYSTDEAVFNGTCLLAETARRILTEEGRS